MTLIQILGFSVFVIWAVWAGINAYEAEKAEKREDARQKELIKQYNEHRVWLREQYKEEHGEYPQEPSPCSTMPWIY